MGDRCLAQGLVMPPLAGLNGAFALPHIIAPIQHRLTWGRGFRQPPWSNHSARMLRKYIGQSIGDRKGKGNKHGVWVH